MYNQNYQIILYLNAKDKTDTFYPFYAKSEIVTPYNFKCGNLNIYVKM